MQLVIGATGLLGHEICRRLRDRGEDVRAFVRVTSDAAKVESLAALGCEILTGDLHDRASLDRATRDVEGVITTASTTLSRQPHDSLDKTDLQGQIDLVDAAEHNDVKRFVLISFSGNLEGNTKLHNAKRKVEAKVLESGISYTILRPSCFMEIWLSPVLGFDAQNRKAQIFGRGDQPMSYISFFDVAEFAVRSLLTDVAANRTVELGGPQALTPREVVSIFEKEFGGPFAVDFVPQLALEQQFKSATDEYQKTFAGLMLGVCNGDSIEMDATAARFGMKLTSVRDYARRLRAT